MVHIDSSAVVENSLLYALTDLFSRSRDDMNSIDNFEYSCQFNESGSDQPLVFALYSSIVF